MSQRSDGFLGRRRTFEPKGWPTLLSQTVGCLVARFQILVDSNNEPKQRRKQLGHFKRLGRIGMGIYILLYELEISLSPFSQVLKPAAHIPRRLSHTLRAELALCSYA